MNFFAQQAQARQRTVLLVCGFVMGLVLVVCCIFEGLYWFLVTHSKPGQTPGIEIPLWFASAAAGLILTGAYLGWRMNDGAELAQAMGAREVLARSQDRTEIQYLHVVQEMAISAGCALPRIFVFDDPSINAYAAGAGPDTAIVAVSRGALVHLTRDELQAVVAHEFSHIFNGDMCLNMRMMGALGGLMSISVVGQVMLQAHRVRSPWATLCALLGLMLVVVGAIGLLIARLIKSAVSRQREYLADACAVQFTRNPSALYSALSKVERLGSGLVPERENEDLDSEDLDWLAGVSLIGSSPMQEEGRHKRAAYTRLMGHFFFATQSHSVFDSWMATHPSVRERLHAIDPYGQLHLKRAQPSKDEFSQKAVHQAPAAQHFTDALFMAVTQPNWQAIEPSESATREFKADIAMALRERIPESVSRRLELPSGAAAVVQGLLLSTKPFIRQAQRAILIDHSNALVAEAALYAQSQMVGLPQVLRLPILDLAIPALRKLTPTEQDAFLKIVNLLVLVDGKVNAFELMAQVLLQRNLRPEANRLILGAAAQHMRVVLSYIAYCGERGNAKGADVSYQSALDTVPKVRLRPILPLQDCEPQAVRRSMLALAALSPLEKQNFVDVLKACAMHDQEVRVSEWEIVRVLCQCLAVHCPLAPPGLTTGASIN